MNSYGFGLKNLPTLVVTIFIGGLSACGGSSEESTETIPALDEDLNSPSVRDNPDASGSSNNIEHTKEAKTNQMVPEASRLDPRGFIPSGQWLTGGGIKTLNLDASKIITNDDGRDHDFPACENPIPAPGQASPDNIVIDGNTNDWTVASIVSIDKSGDSGEQKNLDLRSIYWSANTESYYIAIELDSDWSTNDSQLTYLNIFFNSFSLPTNESTIPIASFSYGFAVIEDSLYLLEDEMFTPLTKGNEANQFDFDFAISGNNIEIRLGRHHLSSLENQPFSVDIFTSDEFGQVDRAGPHIVGLIDDYACLVPTPAPDGALSSYKMLVMRRSPSVNQGIAELSYRAMVTALPYAVDLTKSQINDWDTNNVISTGQMSTAGLYIPAVGHFIIDQPNNFANESGLPINHFFVASHELLHSLNVSDYKLPSEWLREGHSNWFTLKIFEAYFGKGVFQKNLIFENNSFIREELQFPSSNHSIDDSNWNKRPHTPLFFYRKAAALFSLLLSAVNYDEFLEQLLTKALRETEFQDSDTFLSNFKALPSYQGEQASNIKASWFDNQENSGIFSVEQVNDTDSDGLFDFQEIQLGTDPSSPDSDLDGISDTFEWSVGLDPQIINTYHFLAADNLLSDWEINHSDKLVSSFQNLGNAITCGESSNISRFGVVKHEDKVFIAIELAKQPQESYIDQLQIVIFVNTPDHKPQVIVPFGSSYYLIKNEDNSLLRSNQLLAPFRHKTLEISLKSNWFNWDEAPPQGSKFRIVTYIGNQQCDYTENIQPQEL